MQVYLLILLFTKGFAMGDRTEQINQYIKIIQEGILKAHTFVLPENASTHKPNNTLLRDYYKSYDYVVVGGGSAGSVLASRLSEDPQNSVLLLEAGGLENAFASIPGVDIYLQGLEFNWNYKTTPQKCACLGMINKQCSYPRGKGLGGSSLINGLMYVRGNKEDFDNWFKLGNLGWSYKDVLPYFKKSENFTITGDAEYHGTTGKLNVEYHKPTSSHLNAFIEANVELGYNVVDYNGKNQIGVSKTQHNSIQGKRLSTARAFLNPVLSRQNLEVLTNSYVIKIMIDQLTKTASGVIFTYNGILYKVLAKKEVILSAGVIGSPQILMLSGIGPREHLETLGIYVNKDLPVGKSFQDHAFYIGMQFFTNITNPVKSIEKHVEEFLDGQGALTIGSNSQGVGFYKSKYNNYSFSQNPDYELVLQPIHDGVSYLEKTYQYSKSAYDLLWGKQNAQQTILFSCILLHPKSYGSIELKSSNPYEYPLIDAQFLTDKDGKDIELLYEITQFVIKLANTKAFQKVNATLSHFPFPPCTKYHKFLSKNYWYCHIKYFTSHSFHGSSTCKMGPSPMNSVVDSNLRVYGIKKLRVVDASIFPTPVSGHNNAVVIMIAEKAADIIKNNKF